MDQCFPNERRASRTLALAYPNADPELREELAYLVSARRRTIDDALKYLEEQGKAAEEEAQQEKKKAEHKVQLQEKSRKQLLEAAAARREAEVAAAAAASASSTPSKANTTTVAPRAPYSATPTPTKAAAAAPTRPVPPPATAKAAPGTAATKPTAPAAKTAPTTTTTNTTRAAAAATSAATQRPSGSAAAAATKAPVKAPVKAATTTTSAKAPVAPSSTHSSVDKFEAGSPVTAKPHLQSSSTNAAPIVSDASPSMNPDKNLVHYFYGDSPENYDKEVIGSGGQVILFTTSMTDDRQVRDHCRQIENLLFLKRIPYHIMDVADSAFLQRKAKEVYFKATKNHKMPKMPILCVDNTYVGNYVTLQELEDDDMMDDKLESAGFVNPYRKKKLTPEEEAARQREIEEAEAARQKELAEAEAKRKTEERVAWLLKRQALETALMEKEDAIAAQFKAEEDAIINRKLPTAADIIAAANAHKNRDLATSAKTAAPLPSFALEASQPPSHRRGSGSESHNRDGQEPLSASAVVANAMRKRQAVMTYTEHVPSASQRARGDKKASAFSRGDDENPFRRSSATATSTPSHETPYQNTLSGSTNENSVPRRTPGRSGEYSIHPSNGSTPHNVARPLLTMHNAPTPAGGHTPAGTSSAATQNRLANGTQDNNAKKRYGTATLLSPAAKMVGNGSTNGTPSGSAANSRRASAQTPKMIPARGS